MHFNSYKNKTILLTGNTGFKGSWLSLWLSQLGANVIGVSNDVPTNPSLFETLDLEKKIKYIAADIRDTDKIRNIVKDVKPDFIFHLAAQSLVREAYQDPVKTISTNVLGTANVLDSLRYHSSPCHVVIVTSDKCYENKEWIWGYRENEQLGGKDPYSASKASAEICTMAFFYSFFSDKSCPIRIATARAGNVIGGGDWARDRLVPDAMKAWNEKRPIKVRSPYSTRPWQHVLEPLSGYLTLGLALESNSSLTGQSFNFGPAPDQDKTVLDLLGSMSKHWGFSDNFDPVHIEKDNALHEAQLLKLNCDLARQVLLWKPVLTFDQTASFTSEWYLTYIKTPDRILEFTLNQLAYYEEHAMRKELPWTMNQRSPKD